MDKKIPVFNKVYAEGPICLMSTSGLQWEDVAVLLMCHLRKVDTQEGMNTHGFQRSIKA